MVRPLVFDLRKDTHVLRSDLVVLQDSSLVFGLFGF